MRTYIWSMLARVVAAFAARGRGARTSASSARTRSPPSSAAATATSRRRTCTSTRPTARRSTSRSATSTSSPATRRRSATRANASRSTATTRWSPARPSRSTACSTARTSTPYEPPETPEYKVEGRRRLLRGAVPPAYVKPRARASVVNAEYRPYVTSRPTVEVQPPPEWHGEVYVRAGAYVRRRWRCARRACSSPPPPRVVVEVRAPGVYVSRRAPHVVVGAPRAARRRRRAARRMCRRRAAARRRSARRVRAWCVGERAPAAATWAARHEVRTTTAARRRHHDSGGHRRMAQSDAAYLMHCRVAARRSLRAGGCSKKPTEGGVRLEQVYDVVHRGRAQARHLPADRSGALQRAKMRGRPLDGVDTVVCEYGSPDALALGKKAGEQWVGAGHHRRRPR